MTVFPACLVLAGSCAPPPPNLSAALQGIEKSKFLACSGPPALEYSRGGQDQMSFLTNLQRGQYLGLGSPAAAPVENCSVDAAFERGRLVGSRFFGNMAMCDAVFAPCLSR